MHIIFYFKEPECFVRLKCVGSNLTFWHSYCYTYCYYPVIFTENKPKFTFSPAECNRYRGVIMSTIAFFPPKNGFTLGPRSFCFLVNACVFKCGIDLYFVRHFSVRNMCRFSLDRKLPRENLAKMVHSLH